jgi:hypothetical protein
MSEDHDDRKDRIESLSHEHRVIVNERDRLRRQLDDLDVRLRQVVMAQHQLNMDELRDRLYAAEELIFKMRSEGRMTPEDALDLRRALGILNGKYVSN